MISKYRQMRVMKFGGTSVGSPQRMKDVAKLITDGKRKVVVLSAMSGTTNSLVEISDYMKKRNFESANAMINRLRIKYLQHVEELYSTDEMKAKTRKFLEDEFMYLHSFSSSNYDDTVEKAILAQGEIISTNMVTNYLLECGVKVVLVPALDYMLIDEDKEPQMKPIKDYWTALLDREPDTEIFLTQGFICRNTNGEIDNLQFGLHSQPYRCCHAHGRNPDLDRHRRHAQQRPTLCGRHYTCSPVKL